MKFVVDAGRIEDMVLVSDSESGMGHRLVPRHAVSVRTRFGHEYTHNHRFPDTNAGLVAARRLARAVGAKLAQEGIAGLDLTYWHVRTIYGSDAYLDEESDLVQREKDDALFGG